MRGLKARLAFFEESLIGMVEMLHCYNAIPTPVE